MVFFLIELKLIAKYIISKKKNKKDVMVDLLKTKPPLYLKTDFQRSQNIGDKVV